MEASGAFKDIRSSIEGGHPEIQILFDQERASQLGLAVRDIADRVVSNVRGRRGDALSPAGKENRRAGAQRRYARRVHRGSAQPRGEPGLGSTGAALRGRRSAPRHGTRGNPPRQPGTRRGDLGGARSTAISATRRVTAQEILAQTTLPVGHHGLGVGPERGDDAELPLAGPGIRARGVPGLPRDGLAVRIAAAPLRHPVHDSHGAHRLGLGPVHHRHHHQLGGAHRPHHAGRHRGEQRHRAHRRHQPGARTRPRDDRGHQARRHARACAPSSSPA